MQPRFLKIPLKSIKSPIIPNDDFWTVRVSSLLWWKMRRFHNDPGESKPRIFSHVKVWFYVYFGIIQLTVCFWLDRKLIIWWSASTRGRYIPENVLNCGNHIQPFSARWLSVQLFSTLMNEIVTFVTNLKMSISHFW